MSTSKLPSGEKVRVKHYKSIPRTSNPEKTYDHEKKIALVKYNSTSQLRQNFEENENLQGWVRNYVNYGGGSHWMDTSITPEKAIACATEGIDSSVPLIMEERKRAEKLDVQIQFPSWAPDIVGAFPSVPDFLAGSPECMRRMVNQVTDTRPVRIFVGMASSSAFSSNALEKRGALVSALALQLSKTRQVEVWAINSGYKLVTGKGYYDWSVMVKLPRNCSAKDMSFWLCNQASVRGLLYAAERCFSGPLSWPGRLSGCNYFSPEGIRRHAEIWGATESDIVIPFPYLNNIDTEMILNPDGWMRNALKRVNAM